MGLRDQEGSNVRAECSDTQGVAGAERLYSHPVDGSLSGAVLLSAVVPIFRKTREPQPAASRANRAFAKCVPEPSWQNIRSG